MAAKISLAEAERMLESAKKGLAAAQADIATKATAGEDVHSINKLVLSLAECQGSYKAISRMTQMLRWNETHTVADHGDVREELTELLLTGADDGWSGRGNDVKRAEFDGLRKQIQTILRSF